MTRDELVSEYKRIVYEYNIHPITYIKHWLNNNILTEEEIREITPLVYSGVPSKELTKYIDEIIYEKLLKELDK